MEDKLVSFEAAKLAKNNNFPYMDYGYGYSDDGLLVDPMFTTVICKAPTQTSLQKWLREVHNIHIMINYKPNKKMWDAMAYSLLLSGKEFTNEYFIWKNLDNLDDYNTYEEALENGLIEALKIINHGG